jgi:hypothetical protein
MVPVEERFQFGSTHNGSTNPVPGSILKKTNSNSWATVNQHPPVHTQVLEMHT